MIIRMADEIKRVVDEIILYKETEEQPMSIRDMQNYLKPLIDNYKSIIEIAEREKDSLQQEYENSQAGGKKSRKTRKMRRRS
jgi:uncharacterized protein with ParB-like and HNH nuclease domain